MDFDRVRKNPMDLTTVIVSTISSVVASGFTAYFTSRSKVAEERRKWEQDFKLKYAEARNQNPDSAKILAEQYAIGYLIRHSNAMPSSRTFIAPHTRITIGRSPTCEIVVTDSFVSSNSAVVEAEAKEVFLLDMNTRSGTFLNGERLRGGDRVQLSRGDKITVGKTALVFHLF
jgi:hypothetical protein